MSSHSSSIGAPGRDVINEEFTLLEVRPTQQSVQTPGSEMLLMVDVRIGSSNHQFVVGGYWSTSGFRLTLMLELDKIAPAEGSNFPQTTTMLYGVTLSDPSDVLKDRVQQAINRQDVGRPKNPVEAFTRRKAVDDWCIGGGDAAADPRT